MTAYLSILVADFPFFFFEILLCRKMIQDPLQIFKQVFLAQYMQQS